MVVMLACFWVSARWDVLLEVLSRAEVGLPTQANASGPTNRGYLEILSGQTECVGV